MKHIFSLLLALLVLLPAGCDKLPRHGLLDGQWQLLRVDDRDVSQQHIYWRFQLDIVNFFPLHQRLATDIPYTDIYSRFEHQGDSLRFTQPFLGVRSEGRDSLLAPNHNIDLAPIGLTKLHTSFRVAELKASSLRLEQGKHTWLFRKF